MNYMIEMIDKVLPVLTDNMTIKEARKLMDAYSDFAIQQYWEAALLPLIKQHEVAKSKSNEA